MKKKAPKPPPIELTQEQERTFLIFAGVVVLGILAGHIPAPKWLKDLPPVGGRVAGAWRGKGSFGKAPFGTQTSHRSR